MNDAEHDTLTIRLDVPKLSDFSLNKIYSGRHWKNRHFDSSYWHLLVQGKLKNAKLFQRPVKILFLWPPGLDIDNHAYIRKMIIDGLKGHVIVDDTRKYVTRLEEEFHDGKEIIMVVSEHRKGAR